MLESLFSKFVGLLVSFCESCKIFKNSFFYITPPIAAFMCTRKGRRGKRGTKEQGKNVQKKEEKVKIF